MKFKTFILLFLNVSLFSFTPNSDIVIDPLPSYEIDLVLDLENNQMKGSATIKIPSSNINAGVVQFNISYLHNSVMNIKSITSTSGHHLKYGNPDINGVIEVRSLDKVKQVNIEYSFQVDSSQLDPFGYYAFANFAGTRWAYPRLLRPDGEEYRFADYSVKFEYPKTFGVLTSGGDGSRRLDGDKIIAEYSADHVEGFAIIAGEGFIVERYEDCGVPVVAFYHPDFSKKFQNIISYTKEAAAWYHRTYGFFPLEQVGIIQGHSTWSGGFPLPNLFAIHLGNLSDEFLTWITAHELGHYYWALYVLGDEERLDWIQLALGIWTDQLYIAERNGKSIVAQWNQNRGQGASIIDYLEALVANHEQTLGLLNEETRDFNFDYNSLIRHSKGATGLYLQSLLIGPERFLEMQRMILKNYRYKPLPEQDFITILEEAGITGATTFFESWKKGNATIGMSVKSVYPDNNNENWWIIFQRTGTVGYPVQAEVISGQGQIVAHTVKAKTILDTLVVSFQPEDIFLDPKGIIPMWNSSSPDINASFALAFYRAKIDEPFLKLAKSVLMENPNDSFLRYRYTRRLYKLSRWEEAATVWPESRKCISLYDCYASIYSARALGQLGRHTEATQLLDSIQIVTEKYGAVSFWNTVRGELKK